MINNVNSKRLYFKSPLIGNRYSENFELPDFLREDGKFSREKTLNKIVREESETERRANELIKVLKFIIRSTGFELIERVKIRDVKTGKEFR